MDRQNGLRKVLEEQQRWKYRGGEKKSEGEREGCGGERRGGGGGVGVLMPQWAKTTPKFNGIPTPQKLLQIDKPKEISSIQARGSLLCKACCLSKEMVSLSIFLLSIYLFCSR